MKKVISVLIVLVLFFFLGLLLDNAPYWKCALSALSVVIFLFPVLSAFINFEVIRESSIGNNSIQIIAFLVSALTSLVVFVTGIIMLTSMHGINNKMSYINIFCLIYTLLFVIFFWMRQRAPNDAIVVQGIDVYHPNERIWKLSLSWKKVTFIWDDEGLLLLQAGGIVYTRDGTVSLKIQGRITLQQKRVGQINLQRVKEVITEEIKNWIARLDCSEKSVGETIDLVRGEKAEWTIAGTRWLWVGENSEITTSPLFS